MRWGDMDAYGHINNVQIVRMMEEARIAAFGPPRGTGMPGIEPEVGLFNEVPDGTLALVVDHKIRYVKTLEYRNVPAVVQVWIGAVKGASFDIHYVVQDPVTRRGLRPGQQPPRVCGRGLRARPASDTRAKGTDGAVHSFERTTVTDTPPPVARRGAHPKLGISTKER